MATATAVSSTSPPPPLATDEDSRREDTPSPRPSTPAEPSPTTSGPTTPSRVSTFDFGEGEEGAKALPPVDGGRHAWQFLAAGFLLECVLLTFHRPARADLATCLQDFRVRPHPALCSPSASLILLPYSWGYAFSFATILVYLQSHDPWQQNSLSALSAIGTTQLGLLYVLPWVPLFSWVRHNWKLPTPRAPAGRLQWWSCGGTTSSCASFSGLHWSSAAQACCFLAGQLRFVIAHQALLSVDTNGGLRAALAARRPARLPLRRRQHPHLRASLSLLQ